MKLDRARVVGARERLGASLFDGGLDGEDGTVGAGDTDEGAEDDDGPVDEDTDAEGDRLVLAHARAVEVDPLVRREREAEHRAEEGADQADEVTEAGNGRAEEVRNGGASEHARDPVDPVLDGVLREVLRVGEQADKDVLGGDVGVEDTGHEETGEGETVADLLHQRASRAESRGGDELTAEVVDDGAADDVHGGRDGLAGDDGLGEVAGVAHFRDNAVTRRWHWTSVLVLRDRNPDTVSRLSVYSRASQAHRQRRR